MNLRIGSLYVNRLGYGAMRITGEGIWGEPADHDNAIRVLQRATQIGINFIDTADAYGPEVSENLIAEALYPYEGIIIATKGGLTRSGPGEWTPDCSPDHLKEACEASLRRLKVDRIDLYQLHTVDENVPFEDSYQTLLDLQKKGKIRHIGLSNIEPEHFKIAMKMGPFVSVQNNYNVFNREHEDVLKLCEGQGIAFIPYFPIGGDGTNMQQRVLSEVAKVHDASEQQIAIAWLLAKSPVMLPIPGTASLDHLIENVAAGKIRLTAEELQMLTNLS